MNSAVAILNKIDEISYEDDLVIRYDLFKLLDQVVSKKLTFIHGPAGYGKTTLVSSWIERNDYSSNALWINIQKNKCEAIDFWYPIIEVLERYLSMTISDKKQFINNSELLFSKLSELMESILNAKKHVFIVIDNFELLKEKNIFERAINSYFLIPDNMHFILLSRTLPVLGFSELKLNNTFLEVNVYDLKFTSKETKYFFNEIYNLNLDNKEINQISSFAEGWPSILKLLALDLHGKSLFMHTIENIFNNNYSIYEYIDREIFHDLDTDIQNFMIKTSILNNLNYKLCTYLVDKASNIDILEFLLKSNIITKSNETGILKYHPLLKSFLKDKLFKEDFSIIKSLYVKAANWCTKNHMEIDAFEYYLEIHEYAECLEILEKNLNIFLSNGEFIKLIYVVEKLPIDILLKEPTIVIYYCLALALTGKLDRDESILFLKGIDINSDHFKDFSHEILFIRVASAIVRLDLEYGLSLAKNYTESQPTLELFKEIANASLGDLYFFVGDFDKSEAYYKEYTIYLHKKQNIYLYFTAKYRIGLNKLLAGNLYEAGKIFRDNLNKILYTDKPLNYIADEFYEGLAKINYELNDLDKSLYYINKAINLTLMSNQYDDLIGEYTLLSKILIEQNKTDEAFDIVLKINDLVNKYNNTFLLSLNIYHIVILLDKMDKMDIAKNLMLKFFPVKRSIDYFAYESQHFAVAFILFKENKLDSAIDLLNKMKDSIFNSKRLTSQIEFLILMSIIKYTNGDKKEALVNLKQALNIGFPKHYQRIFFDYAYYIKNIVIDLNDSNIILDEETKSHICKLLKYMNSMNDFGNTKELDANDPLSKREKEVLQLVAEGMSNIEISQKIYISESTVKKHLNNIFNKLNAKNRAQAIKFYNTCYV
ncbi:AAA family ATPase [Clostridium sp. P21]|uniref:AAA family ATPase n=1 Tax=Clostridium muellerianum TaxID=2716538 RepID=A0A7Y0HLF1_9CLOT|nr:LuxR C-terminal-related transcriptional regulator [Clostridium muellerianum]NMM61844.1 AAA family ATPase [Clostridium muellerianum]